RRWCGEFLVPVPVQGRGRCVRRCRPALAQPRHARAAAVGGRTSPFPEGPTRAAEPDRPVRGTNPPLPSAVAVRPPPHPQPLVAVRHLLRPQPVAVRAATRLVLRGGPAPPDPSPADETSPRWATDTRPGR